MLNGFKWMSSEDVRRKLKKKNDREGWRQQQAEESIK